MSKIFKWHKVAEGVDEIYFVNNLFEITVDGKKICLSTFNSELFACSATCPHAGGGFANGYIDALGNIVCPLHRYKFSLLNGRNTSGEGFYLKTYPVEIRSDGIYIGIEEKKTFF